MTNNLKNYQYVEGKNISILINEYLNALVDAGKLDSAKAVEIVLAITETMQSKAIFDIGTSAGIYAIEKGIIKPVETPQEPLEN